MASRHRRRRRPGLAHRPSAERFRFRLPARGGGALSGGPGRGGMAAAGKPVPTCLLLGAAGGGKSLLARRLRQLSVEEAAAELGEPPATQPTFVVDAANPTQVSSSCIQLLSVLSAAQLASVPVLVLFNKIDLPCYMSRVEMKSLFRMQDIISWATQPITILETSARDGTGLADVLQWLRATLGDPR
ncbi:ADP-ribosylation factor-like protein 16 isoform X2 [Falco peregrinus]|uniref:ADP-ribosylation factor-like protein 16 isoform X2 n=1 Tax=Falco peregrinus TaxID=8954 RepID=UPI00247B0832|nr:ADP-ribosylation factor-like protein 16 isoform X2 [Falco peregrinus]